MVDLADFEALARFTKSLSVALHERDPYTRLHCDRVDLMACELGVVCGVSETDMAILRISSIMHDVGKIGIPDSILLKPASLEPDEWKIIKTHSARGQRIVCATLLPNAAEIGAVIRRARVRRARRAAGAPLRRWGAGGGAFCDRKPGRPGSGTAAVPVGAERNAGGPTE